MIVTIRIGANIVLSKAPIGIIEECIAANVFPNPLFEANELAGRSNWETDREITTYQRCGNSLILPRGYMRDLLQILRKKDITCEILDERICSPCQYPKELNGIVLRPYQAQAIDRAILFHQGCIIAPTGSGKTILGLELIRRRSQKTLILVHRQELADQWAEAIKNLLGIDAARIGNGKWDDNALITVGMVQTIAKDPQRARDMHFGMVVADEGHHLPSRTFFDLLAVLPAKFRLSLTATPKRADGLEQIIYRAVGPVIAEIPKSVVESNKGTVPAQVTVIESGFAPDSESWNEYLNDISCSKKRNEKIIDTIPSDTHCLVLVDRVEHCEALYKLAQEKFGDACVIAHGQLSTAERADLMERIKRAKVTIGTTGLLGEGLNIAHWQTLILGSPISSEIKLVQAVGRCTRTFSGKENATIFDFIDDCGFSGSSFKKRVQIYQKHRIWINFPKKEPLTAGAINGAQTNLLRHKPEQVITTD